MNFNRTGSTEAASNAGMGEAAEFSAFQRAWEQPPSPPAITAAFVAGLAHPDFLVEMDAIAVVPQ